MIIVLNKNIIINYLLAGCCTITTRIVYTVTMNSIVFGVMLTHLGLQVHGDNEKKPDWVLAREEKLNTELIYITYTSG